jgi:PEGA domain-containing protein
VTRKSRLFGLTLLCVLLVGLFLPADAAAQRRAVRRGGVRAAVVVGGPVYYSRYYAPFYSPYYYYDPFFWGWGGGYGYWQYPPPYYGYGRYDRTGAARLQVQPKQAQVFVDGYFVGKVDDFDGSLQRLRVEAGEHELEFYLEGYRTVKQRVLFRREGTLTLKHVMEPLAPGETSERPVPAEPPADPGQPRDPAAPQDAPRARPGDRMPQAARGNRDDFGTLAIRVQPGDAEILIDGERWDGSEDGSRLTVQLAEGAHRVEIRKQGYRSYTANVRIRQGRTETINVSLSQ